MIDLKRAAFALTALVVAAIATGLFFLVITAKGVTYIQVLQIGLLFVCCLWLAWGFATALTGIFAATPNRSVRPATWRGTSRTAVVMPIHNEDVPAVLARAASMIEGFERTGFANRFDFHLLSDSNDPEAQAAEKAGVAALRGELSASNRLFYRHRNSNVGRKAGNIADFVTTNGGAYDYMLVLDADSLMRPETMVQMAARMDAAPDVALLQTQPLIIGRESLFGRALQFSAALFSPVYSRGIAALQGREGPFWGHNAIIRTRAFAACCGLPTLSGRAPFGGHILSHDFVEAALLARAGYTVRVDPDLGGSYEEAPSDLIEYAKRDRRWCQGNLQHGAILAAPGLKLWSRVSLVSGIMAYLASPIWLMFLIVSLLDPILAPKPNYFPAGSLFPVFPQPETGKALLLLFGIIVLLLLPKTLITFGRAFGEKGRAFGGALPIIASATAELVLTSLLAPVMMMFQSKAVIEILSGTDAGWPATNREGGGVPIGAAFKATWWMIAAGAALAATAINYAPDLALWMVPIALPLIAAPLLIVATGSPTLGRLAARAGLFATPFERDPEPVIRDYHDWQDRLARLPAFDEGETETPVTGAAGAMPASS